MKNRIIRCVMLLVLLMSLQTGSAIAEVCKWIDESGRVHYADLPQSECKGKKINIEPGPTEEQAQETRDRVKKLIDKQKLQDDIKKYELEREANRQKTRQEKRCSALKFKLETLASKNLKVYSDFPDGPRETTNKEREAMREDVEAEIKKYCK